MVNMIDAGIISNQSWTEPSGVVHPYKEYGWAHLLWNETNVMDGYQVESYNFSTIPSVVGIDWDFRAILAKEDNGFPIYEFFAKPLPWTPPTPFNGLNFQGSWHQEKTFDAKWPNDSLVLKLPNDVTDLNGAISTWRYPQADFGSQIEVGIVNILRTLPASQDINISFGAHWQLKANVSAPDGHLDRYQVDLERTASVNLLVRNGTVIQGVGTFTVKTGEGPSVPITYRSLPSDISTYGTYGMILGSSTVVLAIFHRPLFAWLRQGSRLLARRNPSMRHMFFGSLRSKPTVELSRNGLEVGRNRQPLTALSTKNRLSRNVTDLTPKTAS